MVELVGWPIDRLPDLIKIFFARLKQRNLPHFLKNVMQHKSAVFNTACKAQLNTASTSAVLVSTLIYYGLAFGPIKETTTLLTNGLQTSCLRQHQCSTAWAPYRALLIEEEDLGSILALSYSFFSLVSVTLFGKTDPYKPKVLAACNF